MQIDARELKLFEARLEGLNKVGLKIAIERTLNDTAFETSRVSREIINDKFTVRNTFTTRASNNPISRASRSQPYAEFGSKLDYMANQETGFTKQPIPTFGVSIPTEAASNEKKGATVGGGNRKRPVTPANRRRRLQGKLLNKTYKNLPKNQRVMALVRESIRQKRKFILVGRGSQSIYKVTGNMKNFRLDRMYTVKNRAEIVSSSEWMRPSYIKAYKRQPEFYRNRLSYQLDRVFLK